LATCLKLTRTDGISYFFTNHDAELEIDGDTYSPTDGIIPSSLTQNTGLSTDNMDVVALLGFDKVAEADIAAGQFDYALIDIFIVNYNDISAGVMYLAQGWRIGEIEISDNTFKAELRGKTDLLQKNICELCTPECRAELGDARCKVDLSDSDQTYWYSGAVTEVTNRKSFIDENVPSYADDVFTSGKLTWNGSGDNANREIEVKTFDPDTGAFELYEAMPNDIEIGDEFTVTFGCDKDIETCKSRFNNVKNFRGEPFVPGWDRLMDIIIH